MLFLGVLGGLPSWDPATYTQAFTVTSPGAIFGPGVGRTWACGGCRRECRLGGGQNEQSTGLMSADTNQPFGVVSGGSKKVRGNQL